MQNGWTNRYVVLGCGSNSTQLNEHRTDAVTLYCITEVTSVLDWGAHWRYLANTIEPPMCGGDAAFLSNYFGHLFFFSFSPVVFNEGSQPSLIRGRISPVWRSSLQWSSNAVDSADEVYGSTSLGSPEFQQKSVLILPSWCLASWPVIEPGNAILKLLSNFMKFLLLWTEEGSGRRRTDGMAGRVRHLFRSPRGPGCIIVSLHLANLNWFFYSFYIILTVKKFYMRL